MTFTHFIERERNFYDTYQLVYSALVFGTLDNLNSEVLLLIIQSKSVVCSVIPVQNFCGTGGTTLYHRVWGRGILVRTYHIKSGEEVSLRIYNMGSGEEASLVHTYYIGSGEEVYWYVHTT